MPVGVGLGYDHNTLSHYSLDDIALYSSIPGLEVITPYDSKSAVEYLENWINSPGQIVLRHERQLMPLDIFKLETNLLKNELGILTQRNSKKLIISWGYLGIKLLEKTKGQNIDVLIVDKIT